MGLSLCGFAYIVSTVGIVVYGTDMLQERYVDENTPCCAAVALVCGNLRVVWGDDRGWCCWCCAKIPDYNHYRDVTVNTFLDDERRPWQLCLSGALEAYMFRPYRMQTADQRTRLAKAQQKIDSKRGKRRNAKFLRDQRVRAIDAAQKEKLASASNSKGKVCQS